MSLPDLFRDDREPADKVVVFIVMVIIGLAVIAILASFTTGIPIN